MIRVEFIPPRKAKTLALWSCGQPWAVGLFWKSGNWVFGIEFWRHGTALNFGPIILGASLLRDAPAEEGRGA